MLGRATWLALVACVAIAGCPAPDNAPAPTPGGADGIVLSGTITAPGAAKLAPRAHFAAGSYTVIAQSEQTGNVYRGQTDGSGDFEVDIPEEELGNSFTITILGPDGRAVGPVLFGQMEGEGLTALDLEDDASLGTIELPDDPLDDVLEPGEDADVDDLVNPDLSTRLDENGVPVGLASQGKGEEAQVSGAAGGGQADADEDGLIDLFDADDDGDGVVDDFETDDNQIEGTLGDARANFFMNLKIYAENCAVYYTGTAEEIAARLAVDTVITFEVMTEPVATRSITAANLSETPGPTYLPLAHKLPDADETVEYTLWSDLDYAFTEEEDRFDVFVRPNAVMEAGDSFTVEVTFDDGTTGQYTRMINYVFKNIPELISYGGSAGVRYAFDISNPGVNGTYNNPLPFDGDQDLVLIFKPPLDDTGAYITGMDYTFAVFYEASAAAEPGGGFINEDIDTAATWPAPVSGQTFEGTYLVSAAELGSLSENDTYTVTLPKELFPDTVTLLSTGDAAISSYKIDITAEASTGNAAIMLCFRKD